MELAVVVTGMLVLARVAGLLAGLPVFRSEGVPRYVPLLAGVAVTVLIVPGVQPVAMPSTLGTLGLMLVSEALVGLLGAAGIAATFGAIGLATEIMSLQMGLSMANMFNPVMQAQTSILGVLASWLAGLAFLGLGLHRHALLIVAGSFVRVPPGTAGTATASGPILLTAVGDAIALGVQLAGPILVMVWLINVFVAVLAKLAPRMNVFFSIGLSLSSIVGLMLLALSLPWLLPAHLARVAASMAWLERMLGVL